MISTPKTILHNQVATEFFKTLPSKSVEPLWLKFEAMVPPSPSPAARFTVWRYNEIKPLLLEAGNIVPIEEAERRVLMLVNPAMKAPHTTDTIYAGLQLILPGETAPAHRHVAFALRMVIEGEGGFTAVDGKKMTMHRGDVILTPSGTWHDHGNDGTEPVIWLDGLDLPIFQFFRLNFAEAYPAPRYPSVSATESPCRFPWVPVEKALKDAGGSYSIYSYRLANGEHLSKILSAQAERISAGSSSPEARETTSFVYHVIDGQGFSLIQEPGNEQAQRVEWSAKDTFVVPAWCQVSHTCTQNEGDAYLFAINDRPVLESAGLWRKHQTGGW